MDDWEKGCLMAVSMFIALYGERMKAASVLNELGLSRADCSELEQYHKNNLRKIHGERDGLIALRGLSDNK